MRLLLNVPFTFSETARREWKDIWPGLELIEDSVESANDLNGAGVSVLVTEHVPDELEKWPNLRWVQLLSAGANQLQGHPIQRTEIPVTTASGTHTVPIAQFVTCAWLMMAHRMTRLLEYKPTRQWPDRDALAGSSIRGLTAGILGYGSIGRECARQLSALGARIVCLKRDPTERQDSGFVAFPGTGNPDGKIPEAWYGPEQLREMLSECDLVVVCAPSSPRTFGMMGSAELAALKSGARVVIISRGGIVVERALADALKAGRLAGAVVDCFVEEPPQTDHVFFDTPNLIMTPHMSGVFDGFWPAFASLLAENLRRLKSGAPLLNRINHQHGY